MKLIEALKKVQDLQRKADDLRTMVRKHCAISSLETPEYGDKQREKIDGWIQSHSDILKEILRLRICIQKTNIFTDVDIELEGRMVVKSIAEWIHRRRDLANLELQMWRQLWDKNIKEGVVDGPGGSPIKLEIRRFYNPETRDTKVDHLTSEPGIIDSRMEVVNAITDLMED